MFEDNKGVIRIPKSKKARQHNDLKITKALSESLNQRKPGNTMTKR